MHQMSTENVCQGCYVPTRAPLIDTLCQDCTELHDSPYGAARALQHPFLYAPATAHAPEFCRVCGKGRDSQMHEGSSSMAELYRTHHATQGDAA